MEIKPIKEFKSIANPSEWTIWFDLDDTLWDFSHNTLLALREVYKKFNLDKYWPTSEDWEKDYHSINGPMWESLARKEITQDQIRGVRFSRTLLLGGMAREEAESLGHEMDNFYLEMLSSQTKVVPGAHNLLSQLKNLGFKIGVLSNGFSGIQNKKLVSGKLMQYIDYIVLSDEVGVSKPDVTIYRKAEEVSKTPAERCIMIGDNLTTDILGAMNSHWHLAIWLNTKGDCNSDFSNNGFIHNSKLLKINHLTDLYD